MTTLFSALFQQSTAVLFLVMAVGFLIGHIPLGRLRLGGSGVLIAGLVFGHFGFSLAKDIQTLGIVLFVYAIGLQAGPQIMTSLRKSKGHFLILSLVIVATGGVLAWLIGYWFHLEPTMITGIYAGALTSTPALAAAMETLGNSEVSIGYGLAYPLGMIGVVLMVQLLPLIFRVNLKEEEKKYKAEMTTSSIEKKTFEITNPNVTGRAISECFPDEDEKYNLVRVKRESAILPMHKDSELKLGDHVLVVGEREALLELELLLGKTIDDPIEESKQAQSHWCVISSRQLIGKKLGNLELSAMYGVVLTRVRRGEVEFVPNSNFVLEAGDAVRVSGTPSDCDRFIKLVGGTQETLHQTDILSLAIALVIGILIGLIKIPLGPNLSVGLGIAGGPLIAGLVLGYFGRFRGITGRMPQAARLLIGDLGLYMFLAVAGCQAGAHFVEVFQSQGVLLIISGFVITLGPVIVAAIIGRVFFKMNLLILLGTICGGMTSTPALGVLSKNTESDIPTLGYTGIYPMAVLLTALTAQCLALF